MNKSFGIHFSFCLQLIFPVSITFLTGRLFREFSDSSVGSVCRGTTIHQSWRTFEIISAEESTQIQKCIKQSWFWCLIGLTKLDRCFLKSWPNWLKSCRNHWIFATTIRSPHQKDYLSACKNILTCFLNWFRWPIIDTKNPSFLLSYWIPKRKSFSQYVDAFLQDSQIGCEHAQVFFRKPKIVLWTRGVQCWQPCPKFFAQNSKVFCSDSEKNMNFWFFLDFFPNTIIWTPRLPLWKPYRKYFVFWRATFSLEARLSLD